MNLNVEYTPITEDLNSDSTQDVPERMDGALGPDSKHITPFRTPLARGSTALGMYWDPSFSSKDYPLKMSEYARSLSGKKVRVIFL